MKSFKITALSLVLAVAGGGSVLAQPPGDSRMPAKPMMSSADKEKMTSCMATAPTAMMKAPSCMDTMKTMNMSEADMTKMMACRSMSADMMMRDQQCMAMKEMHPEMMAMPMNSMPMKK